MAAPLVVIVGPTTSGKSALAQELAQHRNGEIICADSRTIYTGMDIGTAKPSRQDRQLVPYHLLDLICPDQRFSVADFQQQARAALDDIAARGRLAIMVGGTGLYIDSVIFDYQFESGIKQDMILRPNTMVIGLRVARPTIKIRSAARLEAMLQAGLLQETRQLLRQYSDKLPGLYYHTLAQHLAGEISLNQAKQQCVQADINLAKRQMTWFKRNPYIHWLDMPEQAESLVGEFLQQSLLQ